MLPTQPTRQFAMMVVVEVRDDQLDALTQLLARIRAETIAVMEGAPPETVLLDFRPLTTVHFARFIVIDKDAFGPTRLVLSTNYDGPVGDPDCSETVAFDAHMRELLVYAGDALDKIYACCVGYPGRAKLRAYLASDEHQVRTPMFYVGSSGRSVGQIRLEAEMRREIDHLLDDEHEEDKVDLTTGAAGIRDQLREVFRRRGVHIAPFPPQPDGSKRVHRLKNRLIAAAVLDVAAAIAAFALLPAPWRFAVGGVLAAPFALLALAALTLRYKETHDPQFEPTHCAAQRAHQERASTDENLFGQNQLTHLVELKPGWFRPVVLRIVFRALQYLAIEIYNKGKLGDIPSIHMARWVFIDGGRRLLFVSNFDSSWQSYLGDFIDQEAGGLTAVWSNTKLYPRARWLLRAGARDAGRFLAWTRNHQRPTAVWYSAYPTLSIRNINEHTHIRRGLAPGSDMDAVQWLYWLRNLDKVSADSLHERESARSSLPGARMHELVESARAPALPLEDIQGLILRGFGHKANARYLLLRIDAARAADARRWLGSLNLTSSAHAPAVENGPDPFINVAFTYTGLEKLELDPTLLDGFPIEFVQGSHHPYRRRINGDIGPNDMAHWAWGANDSLVDVAVMVFAAGDVLPWRDKLVRGAAEAGLETVADLEGRRLHQRKEHFGFRDGIAQPVVLDAGRPEPDGNTVATGEFLLGYEDEYGNVSHSPRTAGGDDFGRNGSYLVFRQLAQDVPAFWNYCASQDSSVAKCATTVASKMIGRWPSGAPLVLHPHDDPDPTAENDDDRFSYLATGTRNDRHGARCPFGAHIRRANPRDWELSHSRGESLRLANLHRIIRRGRPYGDPFTKTLDPAEMIERAKQCEEQGDEAGEDRGLQFLCFNANIERQFEFVQQQWNGNSKLAGMDLDTDVVTGFHGGRPCVVGKPTFTLQSDLEADDIRRRCTGVRGFVNVRGSSYFFTPAIDVVKHLDRFCGTSKGS